MLDVNASAHFVILLTKIGADCVHKSGLDDALYVALFLEDEKGERVKGLEPCDGYSNEIEVRESIPSCEIWRRAVYVPIEDLKPWELDKNWGLYQADGELIDAAAYRRGPGRNLVGQQTKASNLNTSDFEHAPPGKYLYGGNLIGHYGHFLLSSLSRYWLMLFRDLRDFQIVCHGAGTPTSWWSNIFMREIFKALGLTVDNFVVFKRPTIVPEIMVPRPAAEEHNFTHRIFGQLGSTVGQALLRERNLRLNDRPVWLSKLRLGHGVQGIENEEEIITYLVEENVEIIHPQELSLLDQVALFHTRPVIMGSVGSGFHTKLLGGDAAKIICVNPHRTINSNYALIDEVSDNKILFLRPEAESVSGSARYSMSHRISSPREVAECLLTLAAGEIRKIDDADQSLASNE